MQDAGQWEIDKRETNQILSLPLTAFPGVQCGVQCVRWSCKSIRNRKKLELQAENRWELYVAQEILFGVKDLPYECHERGDKAVKYCENSSWTNSFSSSAVCIW